MSFLNRIRKVIGNLVDNTDPLNPIVSLDILPESVSSTTCEDSVLVKSDIPTLLNGEYFGWAQPENTQWSNVPAWDNRSWKVWFEALLTDGLATVNTTPVTDSFATFQLLIDEINNQLIAYGSSFRVIGHADGNRVLVCDIDFNPLLSTDAYITDNQFNNMRLFIEDSVTNNDWLVKAEEPKPVILSNVEFGSTPDYEFKKLQCVCDELKSVPDGVFDPSDSFIVIGTGPIVEVQGWLYNGVNAGDGFMATPFVSGNQISINTLSVDSVDYIPGGIIVNTYTTFQDFIDTVNVLILASGVQLATNSNNDFYVSGSDGNPIAQALVFNFFDDTASAWLIKTWLPATIELTLDGDCKRIQLPVSSQDWALQGNSGTDPGSNFVGTTDATALSFRTNDVEALLIDADGNVGIGTGIPAHKLDVDGNIQFTGALMPAGLPGTTGQVLKSNDLGLAPTWEDNSLKISDLEGADKINSIDNLDFQQTWTWSTIVTQPALTLSAPSLGPLNGSLLRLNAGAGKAITSPDTIAIRVITGTTGGLVLDTGTTGTVSIGTNSNPKAVIVGNTVSGSSVTLRGATASLAMSNTAVNFLTSSNLANGFTFGFSGTNTGNGIVVNANAMTTGSALKVATTNANLNSTDGFLNVANSATPANPLGLFARIQPNATIGSGLRILNNGNVGIGTNNPTDYVHIVKNVDEGVSILLENQNNNPSAYCSIGVLNGDILTGYGSYKSGGYAYSGTSSNHDFRITSNNLTRMNFDKNGNIAAGAFTPTAKFHTSGTLRFEGLGITSANTRFLTVDSTGVVTIKNQNQFKYDIRTVTASTTLTNTDYTVIFNGLNLTATLPVASTGTVYNIKNINATNLSVTGNIDGTVQTITLTQFQSKTFHSDAATWYSI